MKQYESYKPSGVEFIGDIPEHWEVEKLKYLVNINSRTLTEKTDKSYMLKYIDIRSVNYLGLIGQPEQMLFEKSPSRARRIVANGDVIISTVRTYLKAIAYLENVENNWIASTGFAVLESSRKIISPYLYAFVVSKYFIEQVSFRSVGVTYPSINISDLGDIKLALPPLQEQEQIAKFLDTKNRQIEKFIKEKQHQIALLEEQKEAIINQAVTKGLDDSIEFKDSGIEWLGYIPIHWQYAKLKYITNQIVDGTHFTPKYQNIGIPFLRVTDLHNEKINLSKVKYISKEEHKELTKRCNPEQGDLLLSKNGTIGLTKIINWDFEFSIFVSLCLIKMNKNLIVPSFLEYEIKSKVFVQQLAEGGKITSITNLHLEMIREMISLLPPLNEQQEIVKHIKIETSRIDEVITQIQQEIDLIKEYKISLISEVVTGQIDVR